MCDIEEEEEVLEESTALSKSEDDLSGLGGGGLPGLLILSALEPAVTGTSSGSDEPDLEVSLVPAPSSLTTGLMLTLSRRCPQWP